MQQEPKAPGERPGQSDRPEGKRRYVTPALTEYGSIGKLTQGGSGTVR